MGPEGIELTATHKALIFGYFVLWSVFAALGVILGAAYLLYMVQRVIFGALPEKYKELPDLTAVELICLLPLVALVVWIGVYPMPFLEVIESGLVDTLADLSTALR